MKRTFAISTHGLIKGKTDLKVVLNFIQVMNLVIIMLPLYIFATLDFVSGLF